MELAIIVMRPPYGETNAAEAVRYALGARAGEAGVSLFLLEAGVLVARKGQQAKGTGFTALEGFVGDCVEMGVKVYTDKSSLADERLSEADIVEGVRVINGSEASEFIKEADRVLVF
jgi:tRNA 2-thiouridine synthesizing protein D